MAGAGADAAGTVEIDFFYTLQKKGTKEKATLQAASLRFAPGNLRCSRSGCAAELALRCARRSDNRSESVHEACVSCGTQATPPAALLGAS